MNLHHRLFRSAELAGIPSQRHPSPAELNARLPASELRAWDEAVASYQRTYVLRDRDLLFDSELEAIATSLARTADALPPRNLPPGIAAALTSVAPIYRTACWPEDNAVNQAWIRTQQDLLTRYGAAFRTRLPVIYQTAWPTVPFRVDVARFAYRFGAYTNAERGFVHTIIESSDVRNAGLAGTEIIFHEASHAVVFPDHGTIGGEIIVAAKRRRQDATNDLWHALIFFTVGSVAQETFHADGLDYTMYADVNGLFSHAGWRKFREPLRKYWLPYVDGRGTLDDALDRCIAAIDQSM